MTGFLLIVDGTFNTNDLRLTLVNMVGVLNTGETFPVTFSYCASESRDSFDSGIVLKHISVRTGLLVLSLVTGLKDCEQVFPMPFLAVVCKAATGTQARQ